MNKEFIPYEQALALKELGFNEPCLGYWRNEDLPNPITIGQYTTKEDIEYEISGQDEYHNFKNIIALAPLYQQAFRWFREKYKMHAEITWSPSYEYEPEKWSDAIYEITFVNVSYTKEWEAESPDMQRANGKQLTHEEAELECLIKLIEIVKTK
jgi:hypothetical protein